VVSGDVGVKGIAIGSSGMIQPFPCDQTKTIIFQDLCNSNAKQDVLYPNVFFDVFLHKEQIWSPPEFHSPITGYYQPHNHQVTVLQ